MEKTSSQYRAPAIERGSRILEYIAASGSAPTLSDISRALDFGKSSVHGLLRALMDVGWVERKGPGFALGKRIRELAGGPGGQRNITETARPFMEELSERTGESVYLGRPLGERILILNCIEGGGGMRIASKPGVALPLFAAATAKAYFAAMPPEEARGKILSSEMPRFTDHTITEHGKFLAEVAKCRESGYATDDEEYIKGVRAVSSPVKRGERAAAILWIVGFANSLTDAAMNEAGREVARDAALISRLLDTED